VGCEGYFRHRTEVIDPVEMWVVCRCVVPTQQEIDGIGLAGSKRVGECSANPRSGGSWSERVEVADLVQADVTLNVFSELNGVAWLRLLVLYEG
jgi:hypothetical protein